MKKYICICNTYSQLIMALHLNTTILKEDDIYCVLSDHSRNAINVYSKLRELKIFKDVYYVESRYFYDGNSIKNKCLGFLYLLGIKPQFIKNVIVNEKIDEIIYFNREYVVLSLFNMLYQKNKKVLASRYDEGLLSLSSIDDINKLTKKQKVAYTLRSMCGFSNPIKNSGYLYTMFSTLYKGKMPVKTVPKLLQSSEVAAVLRHVFGVEELSMDYSYKYIFFTSVYDFEGGGPIGEYDLVCRIAEEVGKNNLLIKMHPRDTRTVYQESGFNVDRNSSIPWEVIQLSVDFSDKVFLTVNSGSVLSGNAMVKKRVRTYYMYKLCNYSENLACKKTVNEIENLLDKGEMNEIFNTVHIAKNLDDILLE